MTRPLLNARGLRSILNNVSYKDWTFAIATARGGGGFFVQVCFCAPDNSDPCKSPSLYPQKGRKWYVSQFATRSEVVQTAFLAIKTAEEHEMRELFTYKGARVFGPHMSLDQLVAFTTTVPEDVRQEVGAHA